MIYLDVSTVFEIYIYIYTLFHTHTCTYIFVCIQYIYMCSRMLCIWLNLLNASTHPQLVWLLPFEGRAILTLLQDREVAVEVEGFHPDLTLKNRFEDPIGFLQHHGGHHPQIPNKNKRHLSINLLVFNYGSFFWSQK